MLQELDQVAVRVGQVVELSRQLLAERSALMKRLESAEEIGVNLRQQLSQSETQVSELNQRITALDSEMTQNTAQVEEQNTRLQEAVSSMSQEITQLKAQLAQAQADVQQWRQSAQVVRERVAHVLENLPGSSAQGEA